MKKTILALSALAAVAVGYVGLSSFTKQPVSKKFVNEYNAQLVSHQQTGSTYEWVWTVTNPNPGNGLNGTMQNLSHWSLAISDLVSLQDIVSVSYSTDGINYMPLPVALAIDKSQECYRGTVLKFDQGTTGSAPTYYKLELNRDFGTGYTMANFKSGSKTGCYNGTVVGLAPDAGDGGGVIR